MVSMKEMIEQRNKATADARAILDKADAEERELSAEERQQYDRFDADVDRLNIDIDARRAKSNRQTDPAVLQHAATPEKEAVLLVRGQELRIQPGTREHQRCSPAYRAAWLAYALGGEIALDQARAAGGREFLGLQVAKDTKGGYLAPPTFVAQLIKFLDDLVFMRGLANVLPPMLSAVNIGVPTWDTDPGDADWTAEIPASDLSEDDTATVGKREFMPHLMTKLVKMSKKMLRASTVVDPETYMISRLGYKCGITEEKAYLTGPGNQRPLGAFIASNDGVPTSRDITASSATAFVFDDLINVLFNLKAAYQARATWVVSREFLKRARKLKDGEGRYIVAQSNQNSGAPGTLVDRPFAMSEYAPSTFTTGQYVAVLADWKTGYWIADSLELEIQYLGELFALKNQVGLLASKETDGAPVLAEAFSRLILA